MSVKYIIYADNFNIIVLLHLLMQTFDDTLLKNFPLGMCCMYLIYFYGMFSNIERNVISFL